MKFFGRGPQSTKQIMSSNITDQTHTASDSISQDKTQPNVLETSSVVKLPVGHFLKQFPQEPIHQFEHTLEWRGNILSVYCPHSCEYSGRWKRTDNGFIRIGDLIGKEDGSKS